MEGAEWSTVQMRDVMSAVKQVRPGSSVLIKHYTWPGGISMFKPEAVSYQTGYLCLVFLVFFPSHLCHNGSLRALGGSRGIQNLHACLY